LFVTGFQTVSARVYEPPKPPADTRPAAGSWSWDNEDVTGTIVPQYQLAATYDPDYAVLQSEGLQISGAAQICHPYPGGQFGWNAEIRMQTRTGWQSVGTVNRWVPDEEGSYMTCAQVWSGGVYAVFGYWVKPEGWMVDPHYCPTVPSNFDTYVESVSNLVDEFITMGLPILGGRCSIESDLDYMPGGLLLMLEEPIGNLMLPLPLMGAYCGCENIYEESSFYLGPSMD
jgi:hypothetical protein